MIFIADVFKFGQFCGVYTEVTLLEYARKFGFVGKDPVACKYWMIQKGWHI